MSDLLTLTEAATCAGVDASTLRHAIRDNRLAAIKRGRDWFVDRAEIERYMDERQPWHGIPPVPVYWIATYPYHWIVPDDDGALWLVPNIPGGWRGRSRYHPGMHQGLEPVNDATARLMARHIGRALSTDGP